MYGEKRCELLLIMWFDKVRFVLPKVYNDDFDEAHTLQLSIPKQKPFNIF